MIRCGYAGNALGMLEDYEFNVDKSSGSVQPDLDENRFILLPAL